jgi:hypothetical protein
MNTQKKTGSPAIHSKKIPLFDALGAALRQFSKEKQRQLPLLSWPQSSVGSVGG